MKLLLIFPLIFFNYWCLGQNSSDEVGKENSQVSSVKLEEIGSIILKHKKIPEINIEIIYQLIDSIKAKDSVKRSFYFKVLNVIRNNFKNPKSENEYTIFESVSVQLKDYCSSFPNEFFCISDSLLKSYAYDIGEEIRTEEEDPNQYAKDYASKIKQHCNPKYFPKIDQFSKYLFEEMESRK